VIEVVVEFFAFGLVAIGEMERNENLAIGVLRAGIIDPPSETSDRQSTPANPVLQGGLGAQLLRPERSRLPADGRVKRRVSTVPSSMSAGAPSARRWFWGCRRCRRRTDGAVSDNVGVVRRQKPDTV